jgi:hypothetical protein
MRLIMASRRRIASVGPRCVARTGQCAASHGDVVHYSYTKRQNAHIRTGFRSHGSRPRAVFEIFPSRPRPDVDACLKLGGHERRRDSARRGWHQATNGVSGFDGSIHFTAYSVAGHLDQRDATEY